MEEMPPSGDVFLFTFIAKIENYHEAHKSV
jgi:hypothetical protein